MVIKVRQWPLRVQKDRARISTTPKAEIQLLVRAKSSADYYHAQQFHGLDGGVVRVVGDIFYVEAEASDAEAAEHGDADVGGAAYLAYLAFLYSLVVRNVKLGSSRK